MAEEGEGEVKVPDEIKRILDAWEKKDYFGLLLLPGPTVDDLGELHGMHGTHEEYWTHR